MFSLSTYSYNLPEELIAQYPCTPRDSSRLMVVDRASGEITEMVFRELADFLGEGDQLIFNDTKVIPARLHGKRETGGAVEIFLTEPLGEDTWKALARPARKLRAGATVHFSDTFSCKVLEELPEGERKVQFHYEGDFDTALITHGETPLPQYIRRQADNTLDPERYQTVYAANAGAVAAPTAGLHFTPELLNQLSAQDVEQSYITLHVGLGTFRPIQTDDIRQHKMHSERFIITPEAAQQLNTQKRQICVGTTSCRSLEAATKNGTIQPGDYSTDIFIYPGYTFKKVEALLTNFHLPGSTLLMLVSAFAGYDLIMEAYAKAVKDRYRFFSYGDAMLIF